MPGDLTYSGVKAAVGTIKPTLLYERVRAVPSRRRRTMPRDVKGANARRSVTDLLLRFVTAVQKQFPTPPAELLRRAEERASALTDQEREGLKLSSPWIGCR